MSRPSYSARSLRYSSTALKYEISKNHLKGLPLCGVFLSSFPSHLARHVARPVPQGLQGLPPNLVNNRKNSFVPVGRCSEAPKRATDAGQRTSRNVQYENCTSC